MKKNAPWWLSHKPIINVEYEGLDAEAGDAKFITIGKATWNKKDYSAKVWRQVYETGRWSRQSEELPLWRVLDLATLLVATINNKQSNLGEYFQDQESELELRSYLEENMEVLGPKMNQLSEMLKQTPIDISSEGTPNIFSFATSELSQDAMFAWLIRWASPEYKKSDSDLHNIAQDFVRLLMNKDSSFEILSVNVGRQLYNIDVWAEINENSFLAIEDKTGTSIHDNQLTRYKQIAENKYFGKRTDLCFAYVKTDNEPEFILKQIRKLGYVTVDRTDILGCLNKYSGLNPILLNYREHLQKIEEDTISYKTLPYNKWSFYAWQGFYKELEKKDKDKDKDKDKGLDITSWGYVPNPAGGFLGIWWYYKDIEDGKMYLQIEQGKLCFKIHYKGKRNRSIVRGEYHSKLMSVKGDKNPEIVKPARFGAGTVMTIAIVEPNDLFGNDFVNISKVVERLKQYQGLIDDVVNPLKNDQGRINECCE
jgi:hypothetical protein